jgi:hypothetical protein
VATHPTTRALQALVATLRDGFPARLAAADATRFAKVVAAKGPYTVPAGALLTVNGTTVQVSSGTRTASQVALECTVLGTTASADADGRLVITSNTAAAAGLPSKVEIGGGTANAVLGLVERHSSAVRMAIGSPAPLIFEHEIPTSVPADRILVGVEAPLATTPVAPVKGNVHAVRIGIVIVVPGVMGEREPTLEAVRAVAAELDATIRTGDGGGRNQVGGAVYGENVISCLRIRSIADPQLQREPRTGAIFGVVAEEYEVRVYDTEV